MNDARVRPSRLPFQIQVDFRIDEDADILYTTDLSETGMFLETVCPYPVGTKLALRFNLPDSVRTIHVVGEVVRVVEEGETTGRWQVPGMGIRYLSIDREDRERIQSFLRRVAGGSGG